MVFGQLLYMFIATRTCHFTRLLQFGVAHAMSECRGVKPEGDLWLLSVAILCVFFLHWYCFLVTDNDDDDDADWFVGSLLMLTFGLCLLSPVNT